MILDAAYGSITLRADEYEVFHSLLRKFESKLVPRTLLIQLHCTPEVELARIKRRRREPERTITTEYLSRLNHAVETRIDALPESESTLSIDSAALNFAQDKKAQSAVVREVRRALG